MNSISAPLTDMHLLLEMLKIIFHGINNFTCFFDIFNDLFVQVL